MSAITLMRPANATVLNGIVAGTYPINAQSITVTGDVDCQLGELQAGTAQIGYGSDPGDIVLQVGNPSGTNADFTIGAGAGNPLTISRGISASAGNITAPAGTINAFSGITTTNGGIAATNGNIVASNGAMSASTTITAGTGVTITTGNLNCQDGELQGASAQIGYGSVPGTVVLQVGNPAGTNANFTISAGAGNPLAISRAITVNGNITASAGSITVDAGNISADAGTVSAADLTASATITAGNGFTATAGGITINGGNVNCQIGELQGASAQIGYGSVPGTVVLQVGNPAGTNANFTISAGAGNPLTISRAIQPAGLVDANGLTGTAGQYPVANGAGGFVWTTV